MDVTVTQDAAAFQDLAAGHLAEHRVRANMIATVLQSALAGQVADGADWAVAQDGGHVVGAALHSFGFPACIGPAAPPVAAALAVALLEAAGVRELPGVNGPADAAKSFTDAVRRETGVRAHVVMAEGVHVLERLAAPDGVPGAPRRSGDDDVGTTFAWMRAFVTEAVPTEREPPQDRFALRVRGGFFTLWEYGAPVSMAGTHAPAFGVGRIGPVYTPPAQRGRGYGAAATAAAVHRLLDAGAQDVMLFTDLANRTSNGVYARLGFRRVGEATLWRFGS